MKRQTAKNGGRPKARKKPKPTRLEKMSKKILDHLEDTGRLFQQSPLDAGGYNPRSGHGSLGKSHLIEKGASKTGRAISGHVAILQGDLQIYHHALKERSSPFLKPDYTPPHERPHLRTKYIKLLRSGSQIIVESLGASGTVHNDNNYPCVLVSFKLSERNLEKLSKPGGEAWEKAQDSFTTLMCSFFVYFAISLELTEATHRSSFAHATLTVAPCHTHMRVNPGLTAPDRLKAVAQAIALTRQVSEEVLAAPHFDEFLTKRESEAGKAKSAVYNIVNRNLAKAFYPGGKRTEKNLFSNFLPANEGIDKVIDWLNGFVKKERAKPELQHAPPLGAYREKLNKFLEHYREMLGVADTGEDVWLPSYMSLIAQARMVGHESKDASGDVSDSDEETDVEIPSQSSVHIYHKKFGAFNGMHCVHTIMSAICSLYEANQSLLIDYNVQKMYFETEDTLDKWFTLHEARRERRKQCQALRPTKTRLAAPSDALRVRVLFADVNHCNVSYQEQEEGVFKPEVDFRLKDGKRPYDYYILDITSATPKEIKANIRSVLEVNPTATIFTLSSDLKLGQLGADFYAHGDVRIFTTKKADLETLYQAMREDQRDQEKNEGVERLFDHRPRRFMKRVGGALQFRDIFPSGQSGPRPSERAPPPRKVRSVVLPPVARPGRVENQGSLSPKTPGYEALNRYFTIEENLGGGDCLYYAFTYSRDKSQADWDEAAETVRKQAAKLTADLIAKGAVVPPNPQPGDEQAHKKWRKLHKEGWDSVRGKYNIPADHDLPVEHAPEVDKYVQQKVASLETLQGLLKGIAERYEKLQSAPGEWAGEFEFLGLVLSQGVNLHVYYADSTRTEGYREETYDFQALVEAHYSQVVPPARSAVNIIHVYDLHYVTGIPRTS